MTPMKRMGTPVLTASGLPGMDGALVRFSGSGISTIGWRLQHLYFNLAYSCDQGLVKLIEVGQMPRQTIKDLFSHRFSICMRRLVSFVQHVQPGGFVGNPSVTPRG